MAGKNVELADTRAVAGRHLNQHVFRIVHQPIHDAVPVLLELTGVLLSGIDQGLELGAVGIDADETRHGEIAAGAEDVGDKAVAAKQTVVVCPVAPADFRLALLAAGHQPTLLLREIEDHERGHVLRDPFQHRDLHAVGRKPHAPNIRDGAEFHRQRIGLVFLVPGRSRRRADHAADEKCDETRHVSPPRIWPMS